MEYFTYHHHVLQKEQPDLMGSLKMDMLTIRFRFLRSIQWHRVRTDPYTIESMDLLHQADLLVKFSHLKQQLSDNYDNNRRYATLFSKKLSQVSVPEDEHFASIHEIFQVVLEMVDPEIPLVVGVVDATVREGDVTLDPCSRNWIPASRSFVQGLERVMTLDSDILTRSPTCAVCLEDFEQQLPITQLPCTHHFHLPCIVQCLERNHFCPLCRYVMPMEQG
ncbi:PREDICTED: E3 ubiquitin-protein ligase RNF181-like [Fragaria vesca subsp. vesca]